MICETFDNDWGRGGESEGLLLEMLSLDPIIFSNFN